MLRLARSRAATYRDRNGIRRPRDKQFVKTVGPPLAAPRLGKQLVNLGVHRALARLNEPYDKALRLARTVVRRRVPIARRAAQVVQREVRVVQREVRAVHEFLVAHRAEVRVEHEFRAGLRAVPVGREPQAGRLVGRHAARVGRREVVQVEQPEAQVDRLVASVAPAHEARGVVLHEVVVALVAERVAAAAAGPAGLHREALAAVGRREATDESKFTQRVEQS